MILGNLNKKLFITIIFIYIFFLIFKEKFFLI